MKKTAIASSLLLLCVSNAYCKVTYLHSNPLGSIVAATDETGKQLWVKRYTPYGIESEAGGTANDSGANHGYATHETDKETGLVYMKERYYDVTLGRFISLDPIKADGNHFSYSKNDPLNGIDIGGKEALRFELSIGQYGFNFTGGAFVTYPSPMGDGERFDIGLYYTSNPLSMPASLVYELFDPGNPMANSSIGWGTARATFGIGWNESRSGMDGLGATLYGGYGTMGGGGDVGWDVPMSARDAMSAIPSSFTATYGVQGSDRFLGIIPTPPMNLGYQLDYTYSYSIGDFLIDYAYPAIDQASGGWLSNTSGN